MSYHQNSPEMKDNDTTLRQLRKRPSIIFGGRVAAQNMRRRRFLAFVIAIILLYLLHELQRPSGLLSSEKSTLPINPISTSQYSKHRVLEVDDNYQIPLGTLHDASRGPSAPVQKTTGFITTGLSGFANHGLPGQVHCDSIRYNATISYSLDETLEDDIGVANASFAHHPLVQKHGPGGWSRLLGSSVWLPEQNVYLLVSRLSYTSEPWFSVLRGQIFDSDWNELRNYTITREGQTTVFPSNFDIEFDYEIDGH